MAVSRAIEKTNNYRNIYISWAIYKRYNVGKIELMKSARAMPSRSFHVPIWDFHVLQTYYWS
jgi:hypothetical protein